MPGRNIPRSVQQVIEHSPDGPVTAVTSMHTLGYHGSIGFLPDWLIEAIEALNEAGVSWGEIQDAFRAGPAELAFMLSRYGVEAPAERRHGAEPVREGEIIERLQPHT